MIEEYAGEKGLYGSMTLPTALPAGQNEPVKLEQFLNTQDELDRIDGLIEDKSIMDKIDEEINQITDGLQNEQSKTKNLKSNIDQGRQ
jgi:hypothetical protein